MELIIKNDKELRDYMPNAMVTVGSEVKLYDKLLPWLTDAQQWLEDTLLPHDMLGEVPESAHLVACEAFRMAVPRLDVVLTPNGFATAGSDRLVAASSQRTERLLASLMTERDMLIDTVLHRAPKIKGWAESEPGRFFAATLFNDLSVVWKCGITKCIWEKYLELRHKIMDVEYTLAEQWMSQELMQHLRNASCSNSLSARETVLLHAVRTQIINVLTGNSVSESRMADIVQYIRTNPEDFPLWHSSATAQLFSPPVFRNKKSAPGYFF